MQAQHSIGHSTLKIYSSIASLTRLQGLQEQRSKSRLARQTHMCGLVSRQMHTHATEYVHRLLQGYTCRPCVCPQNQDRDKAAVQRL